MTDLEALEYLYYKCKGFRKRWCPPFFSFCEFEIIFPKGNILPVLIEFNTNSLEKIYAGKLYPVTEEFSVHSAFCSYIYQKLLRCSNQDFKTSNDFCRFFNWNKFYESILKFENPIGR